jgi:hypothetical protein
MRGPAIINKSISFAPRMIHLPLLDQSLRTRNSGNKTEVYDAVRKQWLVLTPEEHVRQLLITYLTMALNYPASLIAVERGLSFGHTTLRFDVAVYNRDTHEPWLLAECKSPDVPITDASLQQLLQYHSKLPTCRYWLLTNGHQTFCADASDKGNITWLTALPAY